MTIYVDLLILSNFILDYCVITYTGIITKDDFKIWRIVLASIFAVIGLVLIFIPNVILFYILRFVWSLIIVLIAFKIVTFKRYMIKLIVFYLLNYIMAGILISFSFQYSRLGVVVDLKNITTWYLLFISFLFAVIITYIYKVIIENQILIKNNILDIMFKVFNTEFYAKGFVDTGNFVCTPIEDIPIVFVDKQLIGDVFDEDRVVDENIPKTYINYRTINGHKKTLAFKPECFAIIVNNKAIYKDVFIVLLEESLNEDFHCLLNPKLLVN